jgi:hypothetical protein
MSSLVLPTPAKRRVVGSQVFQRDVPPEWERELRAISPIHPAHSHLVFRWVHVVGKVRGEWKDRSRWVLYECQPKWAIHPEIRRMLEDRPPRLLPKTLQPGRLAFVDDWAHEFYRVHGSFPRPVWIIQGRAGGNPAGYTHREQRILQAMGEPTEPPPVGARAYADFDGRVIAQILRRDVLRTLEGNLTAFQHRATTDAVKREMEDAETEFRRVFLDWYEGTQAPNADFLAWYTAKTEADQTMRPATTAETNAATRLRDEYIATGTVPVAFPTP